MNSSTMKNIQAATALAGAAGSYCCEGVRSGEQPVGPSGVGSFGASRGGTIVDTARLKMNQLTGLPCSDEQDFWERPDAIDTIFLPDEVGAEAPRPRSACIEEAEAPRPPKFALRKPVPRKKEDRRLDEVASPIPTKKRRTDADVPACIPPRIDTLSPDNTTLDVIPITKDMGPLDTDLDLSIAFGEGTADSPAGRPDFDDGDIQLVQEIAARGSAHHWQPAEERMLCVAVHQYRWDATADQTRRPRQEQWTAIVQKLNHALGDHRKWRWSWDSVNEKWGRTQRTAADVKSSRQKAPPRKAGPGTARAAAKPWTAEEDAELKSLVEQQKKVDEEGYEKKAVRLFRKITEVSPVLEGRNDQQCRDRWTHYLAPGVRPPPSGRLHAGMTGHKWTEEEMIAIYDWIASSGTKWSALVRDCAGPGRPLHGRTDMHVKNLCATKVYTEWAKNRTQQLAKQEAAQGPA